MVVAWSARRGSGWAALLLSLALASTACGGYKPSPYAQRKAHQSRVAQRMRATDVSARRESWRAFERMGVRVHVGPGYRQHEPDYHDDIEAQIERANPILREALGIELEVLSIEPWAHRAPLGELPALVEELAQHDDGRDADWVLGLVGSMPYATNSFRELGMARLLGGHMVIRDMDDFHERERIAQLDTLDAEQQRELYRGRKRHKETTILLHEIGHTLGAVHVESPLAFMSPAYDNRNRVFSDGNLTLMRKVLEYRREDPDARDLRALIGALSSFVQQNPQAGWVPAEREQYVHLLEQARHRIAAFERAARGRSGATAAGEPAPDGEREASSAPAAAAGTDDPALAALSEPDRARFLEARAQARAGDLRPAYEGVSALAEAYPDSYAVQELACQLAMHSGRPIARVRAHCDRMSALAASAGEADAAQRAAPGAPVRRP